MKRSASVYGVSVYRDDHERQEAAVATRFIGWRRTPSAALTLARRTIAFGPWEYATIDAGYLDHDRIEPGVVRVSFTAKDDGRHWYIDPDGQPDPAFPRDPRSAEEHDEGGRRPR